MRRITTIFALTLLIGLTTQSQAQSPPRVDVVFLLDATGSMGFADVDAFTVDVGAIGRVEIRESEPLSVQGQRAVFSAQQVIVKLQR